MQLDKTVTTITTTTITVRRLRVTGGWVVFLGDQDRVVNVFVSDSNWSWTTDTLNTAWTNAQTSPFSINMFQVPGGWIIASGDETDSFFSACFVDDKNWELRLSTDV